MNFPQFPPTDFVQDHDLLTVQEVAKKLRVPVSWVYERTRRRGIEKMPHLKLGKYLRFRYSEIHEWINKQRNF